MADFSTDCLAQRVQDATLDASTTMFPFTLLPMELQQHVWREYCDDLKERPRVLSFSIALGQKANYCLANEFLAIQTRGVRCVMAVHKASREFALKHFPDTLTFGHRLPGGTVRFHKDRDLVLLSSLPIRRNMYFHVEDSEAARSGTLCPPANETFFNQLVIVGIENAYGELASIFEPMQRFLQHEIKLPLLHTVHLPPTLWSRLPKRAITMFEKLTRGSVKGTSFNVRAFRAQVFGEVGNAPVTRELIVCWPRTNKPATKPPLRSQFMLIADSDAYATNLSQYGKRAKNDIAMDKAAAYRIANELGCWQE